MFSIGKYVYKGKYYDIFVVFFGDFFCLVGVSKLRKIFVSKVIIVFMLGCNKLMFNFKGYL